MSTKPIAEFGVAHFKGISVKEKGAEGRYVLVPSGAVFPKHIKLDRCKRFTDDPAKLSQKFLQVNDVLFNSGGVGTLGRSHHISEIEPKTYVPDSFVLVLRTNGEQLLSKYLYYYLQSPAAKQLIEDNTRGTIGITSIKSEAVLGFPISCPSLVEQQRIVRQLDDVFEGIAIAKANAEKNLQSARTLFESQVQSVFSLGGQRWETKNVGEVCSFKRGLTYAKTDEVALSKNVVLRATNIDLATNHLDYGELKYISDAVVVPEDKKVKKDSLIICMASGSKSHLGKVAIIEEDSGYAFGGFMGMLTPSVSLLPKYLFYLMTSGLYRTFINSISDGANINNLTFDKLSLFSLPVPPLSEQKGIVAELDALEASTGRLAATYAAKLRAVDALQASILSQAFSGALKVAS